MLDHSYITKWITGHLLSILYTGNFIKKISTNRGEFLPNWTWLYSLLTDVDTHEIAKVQRLEEQLQRVTPEAFYKPGSVLKLEVNEEEKVLATCEVEQHLRDFRGRKWPIKIFIRVWEINNQLNYSSRRSKLLNPVLYFYFLYFPEPSSSQTTAADDWLEQSPLAIPKAVGQLHPTPLSQHIGEGSVCAGSKDAEKLGKRRYSESSAGHGKCTLLYLICRFCLWNSLLVQVQAVLYVTNFQV